MFTYFYSDFYCKNTVPAAVKHRFSVLEGVAECFSTFIVSAIGFRNGKLYWLLLYQPQVMLATVFLSCRGVLRRVSKARLYYGIFALFNVVKT